MKQWNRVSWALMVSRPRNTFLKEFSFSWVREYEQKWSRMIADLVKVDLAYRFVFFFMWLMNPFMILPQCASPGLSIVITLSKALLRPWKWPIFPQRYQIFWVKTFPYVILSPWTDFFMLVDHPPTLSSGLPLAIPSLAMLPTPSKADIVF